MEYHSVYLIFELLYLKHQATEDSSVKLEYLRDAFHELEFNVNDINGTKQELDFESELASILEDFSCIFECFDNEISFTTEDPDTLYEIIPEFLDEEPTTIDYNMEDFIHSENIYEALRLKAPLNEMQNIFEINKTIMFLYELIAKLEFEGKNTEPARKLINFHKSCLKEFFRSIDNKTYLKIKLCLKHYNDKYLTNEAKPNINSSWYLALLSHNKNAKYALSYDKIFSYIDEEREYDAENSENQNLNIQNTLNFLTECCYISDEIEYFFANFILYLNNYINHLENSNLKKLLLSKKYLLLTTNLLNDTEEYYLEKGTLDTLPLPSYIKEWFNEKSFDFLIGNFKEILHNIKIPNQKINSKNQSNIIINLLLLKTYLDLSINEEIKKELIAEITNSEYYKNPSYSILSDYIDNIIFSPKGINRKRKTN